MFAAVEKREKERKKQTKNTRYWDNKTQTKAIINQRATVRLPYFFSSYALRMSPHPERLARGSHVFSLDE